MVHSGDRGSAHASVIRGDLAKEMGAGSSTSKEQIIPSEVRDLMWDILDGRALLDKLQPKLDGAR